MQIDHETKSTSMSGNKTTCVSIGNNFTIGSSRCQNRIQLAAKHFIEEGVVRAPAAALALGTIRSVSQRQTSIVARNAFLKERTHFDPATSDLLVAASEVSANFIVTLDQELTATQEALKQSQASHSKALQNQGMSQSEINMLTKTQPVTVTVTNSTAADMLASSAPEEVFPATIFTQSAGTTSTIDHLLPNETRPEG
jgi:hypothetical protein